MRIKKRSAKALFGLMLTGALLPAAAMAAHPAVTMLDENGNPVVSSLNDSDTVTAADGSVYKAGPAYSPKKTCGACHDYQAITMAYHFREGVGPRGENLSDTWSDEHDDGTLYEYLANAYGHLLSPGQYGAW